MQTLEYYCFGGNAVKNKKQPLLEVPETVYNRLVRLLIKKVLAEEKQGKKWTGKK